MYFHGRSKRMIQPRLDCNNLSDSTGQPVIQSTLVETLELLHEITSMGPVAYQEYLACFWLICGLTHYVVIS